MELKYTLGLFVQKPTDLFTVGPPFLQLSQEDRISISYEVMIICNTLNDGICIASITWMLEVNAHLFIITAAIDS